jgi:hypothetical protein
MYIWNKNLFCCSTKIELVVNYTNRDSNQQGKPCKGLNGKKKLYIRTNIRRVQMMDFLIANTSDILFLASHILHLHWNYYLNVPSTQGARTVPYQPCINARQMECVSTTRQFPSCLSDPKTLQIYIC